MNLQSRLIRGLALAANAFDALAISEQCPYDMLRLTLVSSPWLKALSELPPVDEGIVAQQRTLAAPSAPMYS